MAELFSNITEFKRFVGGAVDNDEGMLTNIEIDIKAAATQYVIPYLGVALYLDLVTAYPTIPLGDPLENLLPFVQAALGPLALYEASKTKDVRFSQAGITKASENAAYKYQIAEYRNAMLERGYERIELLLRFLDANEAQYPAWGGKSRHRKSLLNFADDFREAAPYHITRYTFEGLRPIILDVEKIVIKSHFPKQFYTYIKSLTTPTSAEVELLAHIRVAIAHFAVEEAIRRKRVSIKGNSIVQFASLESQSYERVMEANNEAIERTATYANVAADRNYNELIRFIKENPSDFPLYFSTAVGGINTDADACGYVPPPLTAEAEQIILDNQKMRYASKVVDL
jgi:hypothetical protein